MISVFILGIYISLYIKYLHAHNAFYVIKHTSFVHVQYVHLATHIRVVGHCRREYAHHVSCVGNKSICVIHAQ